MRTHHLARLALTLALAGAAASVGCGDKNKKQDVKPELAPRYAALERRKPPEIPEWLVGSIMQEVDLAGVQPSRVSNYGLVVLKRPTGDATKVPNPVREYMLREMTKRGSAARTSRGFEYASPETVLRDPRVAIVRVDAFIPPGATRGQRIDVQVSALEDSDTTSLAGGTLFTTDLYRNGANPSSPAASNYSPTPAATSS
jgi:hypothetical protein